MLKILALTMLLVQPIPVHEDEKCPPCPKEEKVQAEPAHFVPGKPDHKTCTCG
jgi:hypothetical protein